MNPVWFSQEKVTVMILYVDLKCPCCYKKVRKLLCKYPQIRDQVFDEEKNKVMITVVCCDPERFRDKLCCKGGKAIQSIEIPEPPPPKKDPGPPKPQPEPVKKVPEPKPKPQPQPQPQPEPVKMPDPKPQPVPVPVPVKMPEPKPLPPPEPVKMPEPKPQPQPQPVPVKMPDPKPQPQPQPQPEPVRMPEPMPMEPFCAPVNVCCQECYEGRDGGPCHYGYGYGPPPGPSPWYGPPPGPGPCYDYGYYAGNRAPCYVSRCDYFSEENPQGCSIM
ncbi:hypothetical protein SSX86_000775 [Deinandra increscens subsp. villosa]|uniref:Uncharacterized protein n=1 Tax=Deinandra increscens subsp. villosa TaxID=3103831 RepID=A0AAP0DQ18_9ASTR